MRKYRIPIFIPHEGCPHQCAFCNQKKITGQTSSTTPQKAREIIKEYLSYFPQGEKEVEIAFFGGSFTALPLSVQEAFYGVTREFLGQFDGIRLSTRPDAVDDKDLALGVKFGVSCIELGAQSADDGVLKAANRGHTMEDTIKAARKIKAHGIKLGIQMMTGMPKSNRETDIRSAEAFLALKPDCMRIYPLLVLKDTPLASTYQAGGFQPQSLEDAVKTAKEIYLMCQKHDVPVIRMGLHAGEDLQEEGNILAGPFHPAFGELVKGRIARDALEKAYNALPQKEKTYKVCVPSKEVSTYVGHKGCNIQYFREHFGVELKICKKEDYA